MRKIAGLMGMTALCCALLCACAPASVNPGENLVSNGGFEQMSGDLPKGWSWGMWLSGEGITYLERSGDAFAGEACAYVENAVPNDARWEQTLQVKPKTLYRFRGLVRAEGCDPSRKGANLSVKDIYGTSQDVHDTHGDWVPIEFYGYTGDGQRELTLMARVGGYGSENVGKAWFDEIEVHEVGKDAVPDGAVVLDDLKPIERTQEEPRESTPPGIGTFFGLAAIGLVFVALCLFVGRGGAPSEALSKAHPLETERREPPVWSNALLLVLGIGLLIRLAVAFFSPGYQTDVNCFSAWAGRMAQGGPGAFYAPEYFCDYPPGYLLVLWIDGILVNLFGLSGNTFAVRLIFRGLPIACDLVGAYLLYRLGRKALGERAALILTAVYAFNPAAIVTGAAWGQVDAVLALGLFCTVWLVERREWRAALPLYVLCVLVKPQALMAGPLGLLALAADLVRTRPRRQIWTGLGIGAAVSLAVAAAVVIPFWGGQQADWLIQKYTATFGTYDQATLNTANLLYLLGGNWKDGAEIAFAGISWNALGTAGMVLVFAYVAAAYWRGKRPDLLWACSGLLFAGMFMLGIRMHERYLLPAILLLGGAYARKRDFRYLIAMAGFSATMLVNTGMVLAFEHLIAPYVWVGNLLAVINLALLALLAWTVWEDAAGTEPRWGSRAKPSAASQAKAFDRRADALLRPRDRSLRWTAKDWLIMGAITLGYTVLAYQGLGDTRAPHSAWKPGSPEEQVVFDLGEERDFALCYYGFGGTMNAAFTVSFSNDGVEWTEENAARMDGGICFRWYEYEFPMLGEDGVQLRDADGDLRWMSGSGEMTARYVRLTALGMGLELFETAFKNPEGGYWPVASVASGQGVTERSVSPQRLIDEQDVAPERFTYMNGTYFDEIYHARTAYEFLHGIHTFEWTHPPLGKLLIMLSVQVFGMTPFGWRFAGATIGVLMLPALYLLAKQLWKRTDLAAFTTLLMALDCMHYTQTRIATIDSYPVFFIMLMYLFMFRYTQMSFYNQKLWKTLIPLALSGLATGLAIASKWIGLYAAVGLAALLFHTLYQRYAERRYALAMDGEDGALRRQTDSFSRDICITLAWCVLWFVVVPSLIYYFSYAVQFAPDGGLNWKRFWGMQESMYSYHSRLKATHAYESKWWQWPIIAKPMWYYAGGRLAGERTSTILAFGNPAVWWGGLAALLAVFVYAVAYALRGARAYSLGRRLDTGEWTRGMLVSASLLLIGFASQYLPWVLVPRSTYIYHYFASVPFIILCMGQCALLGFRDNRKLGYYACGAYLALTAALFIAYFPFASGVAMPVEWAKLMQWGFRLPY